MECFFINLDSQTERRGFLERNFAAHKTAGWYLNRIPAVGPRELAARPSAGTLSPPAKGCFISHQLAVAASLEAPGHALILEDDAMFGPSSCAGIEGALASAAPEQWDILFTDLVIPHPPLMSAMLHMRRELGGSGAQVLLDANNLNFCGATAYVVNAAFKQRLAQLLEVASLDQPYDLFLRNLIAQGAVRASAIFPFPTTLSAYADDSQIASGAMIDIYWNAFRRFIWVDRDLREIETVLSQHGDKYMDAESSVFSRIIGGAFSTTLATEKQ